MTDMQIVTLYWERQEKAISESNLKYGPYCRSIAYKILRQDEDSEECVSDTWLRAWEQIPPARPQKLAAFFAKITRNLAIDRFRAKHAQKRGDGELSLILDELQECITAHDTVEEHIAARELGVLLNRFLRTLPHREAHVLIRRYFYADTVLEIAKRYGLSVNNTHVILSRTRKKLFDFLSQEGYSL